MSATETAPAAEAGLKPGITALTADPGAIGLAGFALTTFVLSLSNAGIISSASAATLGVALFYGGLVQLLAGIYEFFKGSTFGALAFTSYGAFWMAFWYLGANPKVEEAAGHLGVGAFLLGWAIFTIYVTVAALKTSRLQILIFVSLSLTFLFLAIGALADVTAITRIGGVFGLITAVLAWYGSAASVIAFTWKRQVLPVGPIG